MYIHAIKSGPASCRLRGKLCNAWQWHQSQVGISPTTWYNCTCCSPAPGYFSRTPPPKKRALFSFFFFFPGCRYTAAGRSHGTHICPKERRSLRVSVAHHRNGETQEDPLFCHKPDKTRPGSPSPTFRGKCSACGRQQRRRIHNTAVNLGKTATKLFVRVRMRCTRGLLRRDGVNQGEPLRR